MSRWFRFYDDALNDAKVQRLSGDMFKAWANILCIASKHNGILPSVDEVAFGLRLSTTKAGAIVGHLAAAGLLDVIEGGYFRPHNWDSRQYKSDVSNDRVKQHRERKRNAECNVTETLNETSPEQRQNRAEKIEGDGAGASLISPEAFDLSTRVIREGGQDADAPETFGFPYKVQSWLSEGISQDHILATCLSSTVKHPNYLDKAVRNGWRDRDQNPRKSNGSSAGNILVAQDKLIAKLADFDKPIPAELRSGAGENPVRLLSKG